MDAKNRIIDITADVVAAQHGEMDAFEAIYNKTVKYFTAQIYALVKSQHDREDIIQEAYIQIFKSLDRLESPESFLSWGASICRHSAMTYIRTAKRHWGQDDFRPMVSDDEYEGMDVLTAEDERSGFTDPQEQLDAMETKRLLDEMIGSLPEMQRACIILWQDGLSTAEISEQLDIPKGTVNSNVSYAKKKIKEKVLLLEKQGTKLYGLAPIPYFLWLLSQLKDYGYTAMPECPPSIMQNAAEHSGIRNRARTSASSAETVKGAGTAGKSAASIAGKTGGLAAGKAASVKIAALVAAGCVAVGGGAAIGYSAGIFHAEPAAAGDESVEDEALDMENEEASGEGAEAEEGAETAESVHPELPDSDHDGIPDVFTMAVANYFQQGILPDGRQDVNYDFSSPVYYASFDVDGDGQEELIVQNPEASMAAKIEAVYSYEDGGFREERLGFPLMTYYDNGIILELWSHEGGTSIYQYNPESGRYELQGAVHPFWDDVYYPPDEMPDSFPYDIDADGDGCVYCLLPPAADWAWDYSKGTLVDGAGYEEFLGQYIGGAEPLQIPYREFKFEDFQAASAGREIPVVNLDNYVDFYYEREADGKIGAEFWMKEDDFINDFSGKLTWDTGSPEGALAREAREGYSPEDGAAISLLYSLTLDMDGTPPEGYFNGDEIHFYWTMTDDFVRSVEALYGCRLEFSRELTFIVNCP